MLFHYSVSIGDNSSLLLHTPKIPFTIEIQVNPTSLDVSKNSISSIMLELKRDSPGLLIGAFYVPTGIVAILSLASYLINPDVVSNIEIC